MTKSNPVEKKFAFMVCENENRLRDSHSKQNHLKLKSILALNKNWKQLFIRIHVPFFFAPHQLLLILFFDKWNANENISKEYL